MESEERVSYLTLLRNGNFFRFFAAQFVSSLGDWVGVLAIAFLANRIAGPTGIGAVMTARVLPGFFVGPLAGVVADRWDRKKTMIVADTSRAVIIFSLAFLSKPSGGALIYLLGASVILESLTLIWGPAKDASLPHFVSAKQLTHANSLSLIAIYGAWPLASVVYAGLATLAGWLALHVTALSGLQDQHEALALWMDSLSFLFSAGMISTLTIATSRRRKARLDFSQVKADLVEGLRFVAVHKQVRPWLLGIGFTFAAAGAVFSLGIGFVHDVLQGGQAGFAFLVGFLATGMIVGLLAVGLLSKLIQKDILFSSSILLLGVGLIGLASMNSLNSAIPIASALGFFGGCAYATGYALMHETTADEIRGRTFSAAYTIIRLGTLLGLGIFPFIAGAIGDHTITWLPTGPLDVPGTRATLWIAGLVAVGGGMVSMRAIGNRNFVARARPATASGYFVAFEGGEGAGKSTQMAAFVRWLEAQGEEVVTTREPGGTQLGRRVREILLDASEQIDPRAEALLYAADRAQHVADVIKPALEEGKVVVSDRFVDSSLAYQGLARGLGLDEIYGISEWATGATVPDLVFYLKVDPREGLARVPGQHDRIESEAEEFHRAVNDAYTKLAKRFRARFVVIDASATPEEVHRRVVEEYRERMAERLAALEALDDPGPKPVPR
ncbi:MAG TPA: dTMP kinase [Actinomycetota bacterium]|nr:dTMP kinase [Actinomycetota bacterium]